MDIKTKGTSVFKVLEQIQELPDKLYHGAIVTYPQTEYRGSASLMKKLVAGIRELHNFLHVSKEFIKPDEDLISFDVAHHAGMTIEDEYQLLEFDREMHRQEFIKRHLVKILAVMAQMDLLKNKIKLNGHFKNLEGFSFS